MAFVCKDCHDKAEEKARKENVPYPHKWEDHILPGTKLGISYGPCEECGAAGERVDCYIYQGKQS